MKKYHKISVQPQKEAKKSTWSAIQELADQWEERWRKMEEVKHEWEKQAAYNEANGIKCDVEF